MKSTNFCLRALTALAVLAIAIETHNTYAAGAALRAGWEATKAGAQGLAGRVGAFVGAHPAESALGAAGGVGLGAGFWSVASGLNADKAANIGWTEWAKQKASAAWEATKGAPSAAWGSLKSGTAASKEWIMAHPGTAAGIGFGLALVGGTSAYALNRYMANAEKFNEDALAFYKSNVEGNGLADLNEDDLAASEAAFEAYKAVLNEEQIKGLEEMFAARKIVLSAQAEAKANEVPNAIADINRKLDVVATQLNNLTNSLSLIVNQLRTAPVSAPTPIYVESAAPVAVSAEPSSGLEGYNEETLRRMFSAAQRNQRGLAALKSPEVQARLRATGTPLANQMLQFANSR